MGTAQAIPTGHRVVADCRARPPNRFYATPVVDELTEELAANAVVREVTDDMPRAAFDAIAARAQAGDAEGGADPVPAGGGAAEGGEVAAATPWCGVSSPFGWRRAGLESRRSNVGAQALREIASWVAVSAAALGLAGCSDPSRRWESGGIYSVSDGDGFAIVKILALDVDPDMVSVRIYRERFETRPPSIDPRELTLGGIDDPEGFGIGHIPVAPRDFALWFPVHHVTEPVSEDELDGYRMWKESGAGAFPLDAFVEDADPGAAGETEQPR